MRRALTVAAVLAGLSGPASGLFAQAVPEGSQATRVDPGYRRTPSFRNDPFRHVTIPHWGLVFDVGATAANNTLELADVGALLFLNDSSKNPGGLLPGDAIDVLGLIPKGSGLQGSAQGEGGAYLGGPFGHHFALGLSVRGSGYGSFQLDDNVVSLLRDGNGSRQDFSLGNTKGIGLATAEGGAHAMLRFGALGSVDGVHLSLGFGGRYIRPVVFASTRSTVANGGTIRVTGDTIKADIALEQLLTRQPKETMKGSGKAADFLARLEWPTSGFAVEALVANLGSIDIPRVERSTVQFKVNTTRLQEVNDSLKADTLKVQDTITVKLTLPKVVRFTASSWANRILQIDLSATMPVTGEFETPLAVDVGTTWRFIRTLPLRAGIVLGGNQGIGYTGGFAIEGRTMFLQVGGQSLGGFMKKATGVGARFELGLFF